MYILSSKQIAAADKATIQANGISSIDLMEHAATMCFHWLHDRLQGQPIKIHVFCGIGNNGGDGLVISRLLVQNNYDVSCYIVNFSESRSEEFLTNYNRIKEIGHWPKVINNEDEIPEISFEDIVIDCIFGIGLSRPASGFTKQLIRYINSTKVYVLSIDLPSGLFNDKPVKDKDAVIKSGHILTFQTPKLSFLLPGNSAYVNTWEMLDIGLNLRFIEGLKPNLHFITKDDIVTIFKKRNKWSHKGSFGHSMIMGGSFGKIGAVTLATQGALKIGSGLVTAYLPKCGYTIVQISIPEAMVEVDNEKTLEYFNYKTAPTVIGIGPGMGTSEKTQVGFKKFLAENKKPLVLDADALNCISHDLSLLKLLPDQTVITPHPKELERLIGPWENDYDKLAKITHLSTTHKLIIVLKGAHTYITNGTSHYFNSTGNPALATGGSGDVLTGIITGLIAQGYAPLKAAIIGVYLHGKTADIASNYMAIETFTASTILDYLSDTIADLFILKDETSEEEDTPS